MHHYNPQGLDIMNDPRHRYDPTFNWCGLWSPGAVEEGQGQPMLYLRHLDTNGKPFNPEDHHALFKSRDLLYSYLWIAGHSFLNVETGPRGLAKIAPPAWLDRYKWYSRRQQLADSGYITQYSENYQVYANVTNKIPMSGRPYSCYEKGYCFELNRRFWTLFYEQGQMLDLLFWFGLHSRESNGLHFVEFAAGEIPGYSRQVVRRVYDMLCDLQLMRSLTAEECQLLDCRSVRSPLKGKNRVMKGTVSLIRNHPMTCIPTTPFPPLEPDDPDICYISRGPGKEPQIIYTDDEE